MRAKTEIETIEVSGITKPEDVLKLLGLSGPGTSGKFGVGAADHEMHLRNGARAHIDDGARVNAEDGIAVLADIRQWHISVAQQGGDAPLLGASGAHSELDITNVALAWVEDTARLDAGGDIEIDASNDFFVVAVTAAMQKGGLVSAGVGIAVNSFDTTTRAFIGHVAGPSVASGSPVIFIKAGGDLRVHATSNEELWSFAAAAATPSKGTASSGSGMFGFSVSTSIAANYISDLTEAFVASAGTVQVGGDVDLLAQTTSYEVAVAGAASVSKAKVGVTLVGAFAWNELSGAGRAAQRGVDPSPRITRAYIASPVVATGKVQVLARADDKPITITASFGAALPKNGSGLSVDVAGAATIGRYVSLVEAYIGAGVTVKAGGDLVVRASRSLDLLTITGATAFKGTLAGGAAIEETLIGDTVLAYVGDGATLVVGGNLELVSTTSLTVLSLVAAQVAFANWAGAAFTRNVLDLSTIGRAYLGENADATVDNDVLIAAGETTTLSATAGGRTFAGGAGVGLAYGELQIDRILDAGLRTGASLVQGSKPAAAHAAPILRGEPISGIRIDALASDDLRLTVAAGSIGGAVSGSGSPALTLASYTVTAGADAATLRGSSIVLTAMSAPRLWSLAVAGAASTSMPGLSGGGSGGGGPPIATIAAKLLSLAGAAAGVSTTLTSIAKATITGGSVTATGGPITLRAENLVEVKADAGGVGLAVSRGLGGGAVGASAAVNEIFMETTAAIDDAPVVATGDITLTAIASPVIWTMSVSGAVTASAGGSGAFSFSFAGAGAASTNTVTSTVVARLARNATVTSSAGAIRLTANSDSSIYADAGAVALSLSKGGGNFTGAASIAANHIDQSSSAIAEGAALRARDDIALTATTRGTIDALTVAGGGGGMGSGKGISINFAGAHTGSANVITTTTEARISDGSATSLLGAVAVSADDESTLMADAGAVVVALAGGLNGSVGRSVAVNEITSTVRAGVDTAPVTAHGDVSVIARSMPKIDARTLAGAIAAGTGGGSAALTINVAGAASGSRNTVISTTEANIRDTTTVDAGGAVKVSATDTSAIVADAGGFALSLLLSSGAFVSAAVGLSIALNEITATVAASIESAATVTADDDVTVEAISSATIDALTIAGALGALAGTGARSQNTIVKTVSASVIGSTVDAGLDATVAARETSAVMADAGGLAVAEKVGSGTSLPAAGYGETIGVNAIDVEVRAAVDGSTVRADGDVTIDGHSTASIDARTETTTDAVSIGGATGPLGSAFAGAATAAGNDIHSTVNALVTRGSDVTAGGAVDVAAGSAGTINAEAQSAALVITTAGTSAAVTVGGATALNVVRGGTHAEIGAQGTDHVISAAAALTVAASDARSIDSLAYARTFSASTGTGTLNIALGRALADNTIASAVTAIIRAARVLSASLVTVTASDSAVIDAFTIATASAFAWGSHAIEAAVAGAESTNRIARTVDASIEDSSVGALAGRVGPVTLAASATGTIDAIVLSRGSGFVAFGKSVARNLIGYSQAAVDATYSTASGTRTLQHGDTVLVAGGPRAGDVYRYIGPSATSLDLVVADFSDTTVWEQIGLSEAPAGVQASVEDSSIASSGALRLTANGSQRITAHVLSMAQALSSEGATTVAGAGVLAQNKIASHVKAFVDGDGPSGIDVASATLVATDASGIEALAGATSIAASAKGPVATVAVSLAMTKAHNEVAVDVDASIRNADQGVTSPQGISLSASADGRPLFEFTGLTPLDLEAAAASPAASAPTFATLADKFALAGHELPADVRLVSVRPFQVWEVTGAEDDGWPAYFITYNGSAFQVTAPTIDAKAFAASLAVTFGSTPGLSFSGAATEALNAVTSNANAHVDNSRLTTNADVALTATSNATIHALVLGISAAVGGTPGVGASIGVAMAKNLIGHRLDGTASPNQVQAYVSDSTVDAGDGQLSATAIASQTIGALVLAPSVAVAAKGPVGIALSGSGVSVENKIAAHVRAFVDGDAPSSGGAAGISAASIALIARDESTIVATAVAPSLAASFLGSAAIAVSVGVTLAHNEIDNVVEAYVANAAQALAATQGDITLEASSDAGISAVAAAASLSAAFLGSFNGAVSGAGADATNIVRTATTAHVDDSVVDGAGDGAADRDGRLGHRGDDHRGLDRGGGRQRRSRRVGRRGPRPEPHRAPQWRRRHVLGGSRLRSALEHRGCGGARADRDRDRQHRGVRVLGRGRRCGREGRGGRQRRRRERDERHRDLGRRRHRWRRRLRDPRREHRPERERQRGHRRHRRVSVDRRRLRHGRHRGRGRRGARLQRDPQRGRRRDPQRGRRVHAGRLHRVDRHPDVDDRRRRAGREHQRRHRRPGRSRLQRGRSRGHERHPHEDAGADRQQRRDECGGRVADRHRHADDRRPRRVAGDRARRRRLRRRRRGRRVDRPQPHRLASDADDRDVHDAQCGRGRPHRGERRRPRHGRHRGGHARRARGRRVQVPRRRRGAGRPQHRGLRRHGPLGAGRARARPGRGDRVDQRVQPHGSRAHAERDGERDDHRRRGIDRGRARSGPAHGRWLRGRGRRRSQQDRRGRRRVDRGHARRRHHDSRAGQPHGAGQLDHHHDRWRGRRRCRARPARRGRSDDRRRAGDRRHELQRAGGDAVGDGHDDRRRAHDPGHRSGRWRPGPPASRRSRQGSGWGAPCPARGRGRTSTSRPRRRRSWTVDR